ncbi:MAG: helix-turn-helix transcriptional regulator [Kouleothrix sp.]|nr:helix-turn-helix transcriptional regulator [Kouleothrix sp.]
MNRLAMWLQDAIDKEGWSRREAARETTVSYSALTAILNGTTKVPELENLDKLARRFKVPLIRLIEYCDYDLGFTTPADREQYLAQLIARQPEYEEAVEGLLALSPSDFEAAARHIELLRRSDQAGEKP